MLSMTPFQTEPAWLACDCAAAVDTTSGSATAARIGLNMGEVEVRGRGLNSR
jgi:hypothetical protein